MGTWPTASLSMQTSATLHPRSCRVSDPSCSIAGVRGPFDRTARRHGGVRLRIGGSHRRARLHPLFGAFLAGICFPRISTRQGEIRGRLEMLITVLLLPLFFALTGLRTRLDLLNKPTMWLWAAVVLFAATLGKIGGATTAARLTGQSWRDSLALGALLNTRGLVELIVLNIGYNVGVFSPTLFTMLVVMALVTTMCTSPLLNLLGVEDDSLHTRPTGRKRMPPPVLRS